MNQSQIESMLRLLLATGGPVAGLLVNSGMAPSQVNNWLTVLLIVLPPVISGVWSIFRHSDKGNVLAASTVPGATVTVDPVAASAKVTAVAADPTIPHVVTSP